MNQIIKFTMELIYLSSQKKSIVKRYYLSILTFYFIIFGVNAQITTGEVTGEINTIQSVVPFLTIAPDSRAGAMGDVGVATSPDINSLHWNPAKYAFIDGDGGLGLSYSPWLRNLVPDINLASLTAYKRIDDKQVISGSLLYFSLGNITFTDIFGNTLRNFNPNEFAVDLSYSRKFSDNISGALSFRYIYSNLTGGTHVGGTETKPGTSIAADLGTYYQKELSILDKETMLRLGLSISNMGSKMSYTDDQDPDFIPINMRLGGSLEFELDKYNSITIAADINKLLVPTPPVYDSAGVNIIYGMDPDVSV
ncbi:MAG: type IX secretion system outer membrane channel protein PorV, partial [Bacteroidales bacterium]|nr:type IX secretion system outer membrane channel protein PorV [Bacteroidales bacterium]